MAKLHRTDDIHPNCPCYKRPRWTNLVRWPDKNGAECYANARYTVNKRTREVMVGGIKMEVIALGIANIEQSAQRDWRDFQRIKTELAGRDMIGIEVYPEESKVVDPSNYSILWCFPAGFIDCGMGGRNVLPPAAAIAPQREPDPS